MKIYGKIFGSENTNLELSDKAFAAYSDSSETVVEHFDGSYSIHLDRHPTSYNLIRDRMTAEDVNRWYEDKLQEESMKRRVLDELDLSGTPEEYEDCGYLTVNTARNGRDVVWYFDGINELAYYIDTNDKLTDDEIEEQLA
jgi:hypothetical protein